MASLHQPISPPPPDPGSAADWGALSQRVLARVGADPSCVGGALVAYQRSAGVDVAGLATFLGCPLSAVPRLALAQRPVVGTPRFLGAVARSASRTGAHTHRLAALLERTAP
jgi:hypothetical protein